MDPYYSGQAIGYLAVASGKAVYKAGKKAAQKLKDRTTTNDGILREEISERYTDSRPTNNHALDISEGPSTGMNNRWGNSTDGWANVGTRRFDSIHRGSLSSRVSQTGQSDNPPAYQSREDLSLLVPEEEISEEELPEYASIRREAMGADRSAEELDILEMARRGVAWPGR